MASPSKGEGGSLSGVKSTLRDGHRRSRMCAASMCLRTASQAASDSAHSGACFRCDTLFRQATALAEVGGEDEETAAVIDDTAKRLECVLTRFCSDMCAALDSGVPHDTVTRLGTLKFLANILSDNKSGAGVVTSATIGSIASLVQRLLHPNTAVACCESGLMGCLITSMDYISSADDALRLLKSIHTFAARRPDTTVAQLKFDAAKRVQTLMNKFEGEARVHSAACKAVAALACSDVFRKAALECRLAFDCVLSCMQSKESHVLNGCMAVSQLSTLPSVACALADAGSVWALAAVLQRCQAPLVVKHAAGALRNLCSSSSTAREQLIPSGGLQAAARIMVEGRNLGSQLLTNVSALLWCCCKHSPNRSQAVQLGALDGVTHAAGWALSIIGAACMRQVVGIGEMQQPAFIVPESWVPWAAADGSEDDLLFCCCSCLWIAAEGLDTHSRLLSLRALDLISDVFEYLPKVVSASFMRHQENEQEEQQLLEQRALLLVRCGGTLQFLAANASASAGGEFIGVRLMAAVRAFAEGQIGGKVMNEARWIPCRCCGSCCLHSRQRRSVARAALLCLARSIWVPWQPPSRRSCPTLAYIIIGGGGAEILSQSNRDRAVYRGDISSLGLNSYSSSADKPSPLIGSAASKVFAADADRFLSFLWGLQGCNVDRYKCSKVIIPAPSVALPPQSPGARLFNGNVVNTGTCITQGPICLDPVGMLEVFFKNTGIDIFVLYFSGPVSEEGAWIFPHRTMSCDDMLALWTSAMSEFVMRAAVDGEEAAAVALPRLVIVSDSSLSGKWVKRARDISLQEQQLPGCSNVAVQASCGEQELSYQHCTAGGCFTNMFCSYPHHGNSWRTMPNPQVLQQVKDLNSEPL
jgi:hypothetical protein